MPLLFPKFRHQLEKILESTGKPSPEDVESMKSPFAGTMLESIPPTRQVSLSEAFSGASAQALDLMLQCLQFNPDKRVRAADALKHPYVAEFHNPDDEPDYPHGSIQVRTVSMFLLVNIRTSTPCSKESGCINCEQGSRYRTSCTSSIPVIICCKRTRSAERSLCLDIYTTLYPA